MPDTFLAKAIAVLFANWYGAKIFLERSLSVSTDSLHVIAGVLLQLLVAIVTRRPLTSWLPWSCVAAALVFNEAADLWLERWPSLAEQLGESAKDVLLTMLLPTVLMAGLRHWPQLADQRSDRSAGRFDEAPAVEADVTVAPVDGRAAMGDDDDRLV